MSEKIQTVKIEYSAYSEIIYFKINDKIVASIDLNALSQFGDLAQLLDLSKLLNLTLGDQVKTSEAVSFQNDKVTP